MAKRRRLDRAQVVAQAARLADEAGDVYAVTLTELAESLEIRVPSLYNHIANLDDLHDALATYAMQEMLRLLRQITVGKVGREALVAVALAYRMFAQAHPGLYPLTLRAPAPEDTARVALAQELLQLFLLIFASVGVHGDDAIDAVRGLRALLHGYAALEAAEGFKLPYDVDESFRFALLAYLAGLPSMIASRARADVAE